MPVLIGTAGRLRQRQQRTPPPERVVAPRARRSARAVACAAVVAGTWSGVPSTLHAVATGRPPGAATRAAGTLLGAPSIPRGAVAHAVVTAWWTTVLAAVLPRRRTPLWGAVAGLAIGEVDLAIARRWAPAIAHLPRWAQLADHVLFGVLAGAALDRPGRVPRARTG